MNKILYIAIASSLFALTSSVFAYDNGDGTHTVREYTRSDGTTVQEHKSGNAGSGVHCHDNVCS